MDISGKRVALALGGGAARGCAHLGAIAELERRGARIVAVSGTSMGALIGGIYAAGHLATYRDWLESLSRGDVLRMLDPALRSSGLIGAEKIMGTVRDIIGDVAIEELPMPFTAVATELRTGQEVWLQHGPLERAIRASIAIPGVITPLIDGDRMLVDGGLTNLVPVTPLATADADLTVAVSVIGNPHAVRSAEEFAMRTVDAAELALQTMERVITRFQWAAFPPDILIELPSDICGTMEFHRAAEMATLGQARTAVVLDTS